jgi:hypothetical protein
MHQAEYKRTVIPVGASHYGPYLRAVIFPNLAVRFCGAENLFLNCIGIVLDVLGRLGSIFVDPLEALPVADTL